MLYLWQWARVCTRASTRRGTGTLEDRVMRKRHCVIEKLICGDRDSFGWILHCLGIFGDAVCTLFVDLFCAKFD